MRHAIRWKAIAHDILVTASTRGTKPTGGPWKRENPKAAQAELDAIPHPQVIEQPSGKATIETYTSSSAQKIAGTT
jgi:hypothetical protein